MQMRIAGPETAEALAAENKFRINQYQSILNSLETEEGYYSYPEQIKTYQHQQPPQNGNQGGTRSTDPAPPSINESQHRTKSLIGYMSSGFRYLSEILRDDKGEAAATYHQEEPQTHAKPQGTNNASGKAVAAKLRRKKEEETKSLGRL